jgi:alpha-galactosidase
VSTRLCATVVAGIIGLVALLACSASASAEANGVGRTPVMGWSSWDFLRHDPTEAAVEAEAQAMVTSGLSSVGYRYVNLDDDWYACPGPQGPDVDGYGRWIPDAAQFPNQGAVNGIAATAAYVHHLGLRFGIYITPGISQQAVAQRTPIEGTRYTANQIATTTPERNYNCHGMVGLDYSKPGAQAFIDSWADELAAWGVDYVKLDGVGHSDIGDVKAWSQALRRTHRPIGLELSNNLAISDASAWQQYANGWRTGPDIDCYCSRTSYPLTDWTNVEQRFNEVAAWAPYGHPGAFNDYDSIEIGNGAQDGLTPPERQAQLSL